MTSVMNLQCNWYPCCFFNKQANEFKIWSLSGLKESLDLYCAVIHLSLASPISLFLIPVLKIWPNACPLAIRFLRYFDLLTSDCTFCHTELEREILSTEQIARNWTAVECRQIFPDGLLQGWSSTWTVTVQVAVHSQTSVGGLTVKSNDCQGFWVGN